MSKHRGSTAAPQKHIQVLTPFDALDLFASNDAHFSRPWKSAAEANTERGKNGIIHAMKPHAKTALSLALAIIQKGLTLLMLK